VTEAEAVLELQRLQQEAKNHLAPLRFQAFSLEAEVKLAQHLKTPSTQDK
jgi:hypothetical protein